MHVGTPARIANRTSQWTGETGVITTVGPLHGFCVVALDNDSSKPGRKVHVLTRYVQAITR